MKAIEAIDKAFTLAGIKALGSPLDGDVVNWGLTLLQGMIDAWQADGLYIPFVTKTVQIVNGSPITIGTGQTIDIARPRFVRNTSFFRVQGIDYPIAWLPQEEYNLIRNKDIQNQWPLYGYYDGVLPVSSIYFWPEPQNSELHLITDCALPSFADVNITDYSIDVGYSDGIVYELACRACIGIKDVPPDLRRQAQKSVRSIRENNTQPPILNLPYPLYGVRRGTYTDFISG